MVDARRIEIVSDSAVDIPDGSSATVVIRPEKDSKVELRIGKGCSVDSYIIQEREASVSQTNHVGESSVVRSHCLWLSGGRGRVHSLLEGRKAEAYDTHLFVERDSDSLSLDTVLKHIAKDTRGDITVKGVVKDKAEARLEGTITVGKGGSGAESLLSEHVMLLNPGAHATASPELEIENDDVSSTHAASVSQIDEKKIFYLMSRGVSREDAKKLIVEGFLDSGIGRIPDKAFRKEFMAKTSA